MEVDVVNLEKEDDEGKHENGVGKKDLMNSRL